MMPLVVNSFLHGNSMQSYLTLQVARWASIVSEEKLSNTKKQPAIKGKTKPSLQLMWRRDNNPQYLRQEITFFIGSSPNVMIYYSYIQLYLSKIFFRKSSSKLSKCKWWSKNQRFKLQKNLILKKSFLSSYPRNSPKKTCLYFITKATTAYKEKRFAPTSFDNNGVFCAWCIHPLKSVDFMPCLRSAVLLPTLNQTSESVGFSKL